MPVHQHTPTRADSWLTPELPTDPDTTLHDTTRHDTTRHDTTRHRRRPTPDPGEGGVADTRTRIASAPYTRAGVAAVATWYGRIKRRMAFVG